MNAMHTSPSALSATGSRQGHAANHAPAMPQLLDSQDLLRGNKAVTIQHNGSIYRLQATKLGKLILTK